MINGSLVNYEEGKDSVTLTLQNTDAVTLARDVSLFFSAEKYKLEGGTPENAVYGRGSGVLRVLFGAFARRYKFKVTVYQEGEKTTLRIGKAISGTMGGYLGYRRMKKELKRLGELLKSYTS